MYYSINIDDMDEKIWAQINKEESKPLTLPPNRDNLLNYLNTNEIQIVYPDIGKLQERLKLKRTRS